MSSHQSQPSIIIAAHPVAVWRTHIVADHIRHLGGRILDLPAGYLDPYIDHTAQPRWIYLRSGAGKEWVSWHKWQPVPYESFEPTRQRR